MRLSAISYLVIALVGVNQAYARLPQIEVGGSSASAISVSEVRKSFDLTARVDVLTKLDFLQLGISSTVSAIANSTRYVLVGGPTINLYIDDRIQNAFFFRPAVGVRFANVNASTRTQFFYTADFGKRFEVGERVSYSPRVTLSRASNEALQWDIVPLSFSVYF